MSSCAEDIKTMLGVYLDSSENVSEISDFILFPVFVGKEPMEPSNTITVFETPGAPPQLTFDRDEIYEYPSVQVRVRSASYLQGWEQANEIKNALHGRANESWGSNFYTLVRCANGPYLLDYDKNQRVRFIINFDCQRRQS
jgi:hypothetical protein